MLHGCKIDRGAPTISHLFFAHDSYLFFRANIDKCRHIKCCLQVYDGAPGQ